MSQVQTNPVYGSYDCWQCSNLLNQQRQAHKHEREVLAGMIATLVVLLCLAGIIIYVWLLRRVM
ncbi:MAG: hypothetical protein HZA78_07760 [Candidatus Schekmanbacteria bacterium]|nr:hypothetical protein [Candidatus Schekmanbacteria bacterium]